MSLKNTSKVKASLLPLGDRIKLASHNFEKLTCDSCKSSNIIETREGYVCKDCGIVLEIQRLEYYRPYNDDAIQYEVLGARNIGNLRERLCHANSDTLERMSRLNSKRNNEEWIKDKAKIEISRIFNGLNLPISLKTLVFEKFKVIRNALRPGTKYRSIEKLVPIIIYFCMKLRNISVNETELLDISNIKKKDFNYFKLQIQNFIPEYKERDRKEYILQKILEISEHFCMEMSFFYRSKEILYRLWEGIKYTKDDVIVGLVSSLSVLCFYNHHEKKVNINAICKRLGIKMSTIQYQVKKRIFERFKISGFISLVKSSKLLKKIMSKMLLKGPEQYKLDGSPSIDTGRKEYQDVVEIKLGNIDQIFNLNNNINYYLYALRDSNSSCPFFVSLKIYSELMQNRVKGKKKGYKQFELELLKYHLGKDPPDSHLKL